MELFNLIYNMYLDVTYAVKTQDGVTEQIPFSVGVKQGYVCSPIR